MLAAALALFTLALVGGARSKYDDDDVAAGQVGAATFVVRVSDGGYTWRTANSENLTEGSAETVPEAVEAALEALLPFAREDDRVTVWGLDFGRAVATAAVSSAGGGAWRWEARAKGVHELGHAGTRNAAIVAAVTATGVL